MVRTIATATEDPRTKTSPEVIVEEEIDTPWRLILYNDDIHTFEEVIHQLQKALSCSIEEAEKITVTVHTEGKAVVYKGPFEECFKRNAILQEIQLITEIKG
ncbi:MAG TPA: ATP-dependent Clp protease adaptor ClpS [Balneolales bacterium]|nr:ATP-dependent Clp protease adaptor ClpS [Balneolales bacterium]